MKPSSVFQTPLPAAGLQRDSTSGITRRKRKRDGQYADTQHHDAELSPGRADAMEYTAVLTPLERSQRRLAGLPLDQLAPPHPFPHAAAPSSKHKLEAENLHATSAGHHAAHPSAKPSLHLQHISAMTAVLHRCMMARDYDRAARALGLLLRNEWNGRPIDIRHGDLWTIGAEILLRQDTAQQARTGADESRDARLITRAGFERTRLYYERLAIQHPPHKTWLDVVNALDFTVAIFVVWVYVTNQEALQMRDGAVSDTMTHVSEDGSEITMQEAREWELEQAAQIATAMDTRMRDLSSASNPAMIRLRAMVALWMADLVEQYSAATNKQDRRRSLDPVDTTDLFSRFEEPTPDRHHQPRPRLGLDEAMQNRNLATSLFQILHDKHEASPKPSEVF